MTSPYKNPNYVSVDDLVRYEDGEMDEEEVLDLFQRLVNSGLAWTLQGHYGRTAVALIERGLIKLRVKS